MTYTFHGTTISALTKICATAISTVTAAQKELAEDKDGKLPSEQDVLDANFGDMLSFRVQPVLLAKFPVGAIQQLSLSSAPAPALEPSYKSFEEVKKFFEDLKAFLEGTNAEAFNAAAEKSVDVEFKNMGKTLHMSGLADYFHGFVVPNCMFHVNAMYMLLRSKGFKLGKGVYVGSWMSETLVKDWAPLRG